MELDYVKLKEIKPAVAGYIRESQALLKRSAIPGVKEIHDIRVLMKKSRAVLKLISPQMEETYHKRNITDLQEVGRLMSAWRETTVQRKLLREFRKENPDIFTQLRENGIISQLLERPESGTVAGEENISALEQINSRLSKTSYRLRFQSLNKIDPPLLLKELESTYKRLTEIYVACRNNPKPVSLHNFRKKSKDFLYQLTIFRPLNPSEIKLLEKRLDALTQNLGRYNDLEQLVSALGYDYKDSSNLPAMNELIIKIRDAQDHYISRVWPSAYKIFCPGQKLVNLLGFRLLVI
jgi:CHAD domain-containing protein